MKTKRCIALLLLTVYLLTLGGAALRSLTCECVAMHARSHAAAACHLCAHCDRTVQEDDPAAAPFLSAPCCDDRHSTDIALYTDKLSDSERETARCTIITLLPDQTVECPCPTHIPALRETPLPPAEPLVEALWLTTSGFRAPPASV